MSLSKDETQEMEAKVLQLLQSPDKGMQELGLELMQANSLECEEWFDGLDQIYEIANGKKAESKDQLIDFFNETVLDLSFKKMMVLPKSIDLLVNLKGLRLDNNLLKSIPSEIGALANLERLYLDGNQLTSIPPEIGALANLEYLFLDFNPIPKDHIDHLKTIIPKNCEFYP